MVNFDYRKFLKGSVLGLVLVFVYVFSFYYSEGKIKKEKILGTVSAEGNWWECSNPTILSSPTVRSRDEVIPESLWQE